MIVAAPSGPSRHRICRRESCNHDAATPASRYETSLAWRFRAGDFMGEHGSVTQSRQRGFWYRSSHSQGVLLGLAAVAAVGAFLSAFPDSIELYALRAGRLLVAGWLTVTLAAGAAGLAGIAAWQRHARRFESRSKPTPHPIHIGAHIALLLILTVMVAVGSWALLWSAFGRPQISSPPATSPSGAAPSAAPAPSVLAPEKATGNVWSVQNTFDSIKIVLAVVGGIGGVVALTVAYRRQRLGESAEQREETKLFTDRFAGAAKQVGDENAAVRLAGVYALAALADDWRAGRQTCIDVLCAYMRMPYSPPTGGDVSADPKTGLGPLGRLRFLVDRRPVPAAASEPAVEAIRNPLEEREVRSTLIRIVRDHLRLGPKHPQSWQGYDLNFTGAVLDGGDFSGAIFSSGSVSFYEAKFVEGWTDFANARFAGATVTFEAAVVCGGELEFGDSEFSAGTVSFASAQITGGGLDFGGAKFTGSNVKFYGVDFQGGGGDFGGAVFTSGDIDFWGASLSSANAGLSFDGAHFAGGRVSFSAVAFSGGIADFSEPADWTVPPRFGWEGTQPDGLRLPSGWQPPRTSIA